MTRHFILVKTLRALLTALLAVTFVFVMLRFAGDPSSAIYGEEQPKEAIAYFNAQFGLDKPLWRQYIIFLTSLSKGDFGNSFRNGRPATEIVGEVLPATLLLAVAGMAIATLIGFPMGVLAAAREGGITDRLLMTIAVSGYAMPNFFLGILLILIFTLYLQILPSAGGATWAHLVMPALTLGVAYAGILARFVRAAMRDAIDKPFFNAAILRGTRRAAALREHAIPNAALPTITVFGLLVGGLASGATVIETVFAWPGAGRLLVESVTLRDLPVVQCLVTMATLTMVVVNLAVDLAYGYLDPRVRVGGGHGA